VEPTDLPGGDLIASGLDDLRRGLETVPSLLVSIGAPRRRSDVRLYLVGGATAV
jgi:hypothetical protein